VPGPWYSPYTESVILKNALSGQRSCVEAILLCQCRVLTVRPSLWIHSLHAKYGPLIRQGLLAQVALGAHRRGQDWPERSLML
jgi:hypothetical protein